MCQEVRSLTFISLFPLAGAPSEHGHIGGIHHTQEDTMGPHPAIDHIMQFFSYEHLPERLQAVSRPFGELAEKLCEELPSNPELTAGLRKLLEAKDCCVRALVAQ